MTTGRRGTAGRTLLQGDEALEALVRGSGRMAQVLGVTLGPYGSSVIGTPIRSGRPPEFFGRAGELARRIIEIDGAFENIGAMLVRHAACRVDRECGDGVATTAVLVHALLSGLTPIVSSGTSPGSIADRLAVASRLVLSELERLQLAVSRPSAAQTVVSRMVREMELSVAIVQAVEAVGVDGWVDVGRNLAPRADVALIEGTRWAVVNHLVDGSFDSSVREWSEARLLASADSLDTVDEVVPLLSRATEHQLPGLILVCPAVGTKVRTLLAANRGRPGFPEVMAVSLTVTAETPELVEDLATYCGTRVVSRGAGETAASVQFSELGQLRRARLSRRHLNLVAAGSPSHARKRARLLRARMAREQDLDARRALRARAARLEGCTAELAVPTLTETEADDRVATARAAVTVAQLVMRDGVTAGGGAALVQAAVQAERLGGLADPVGRALAFALEAPLRHIARRAGMDPGLMVERVRGSDPGFRFDVESRHWLTPDDVSRLVDPIAVLRCAVEVAVSVVSTVITTSTVVRSRRPRVSLEP